jgi:hypothetical protein
MSNSDIESLLKKLENEVLNIKDEIFRIAWYMRGGVSSLDLFHIYSVEDRSIINKIISENIDLTKKTGMAIL